MKIETTVENFSWLLRGFMSSFNFSGGGYKFAAFEMAQHLIETSDLTSEQKKQICDDLYVITFPKGSIAKAILEKRK